MSFYRSEEQQRDDAQYAYYRAYRDAIGPEDFDYPDNMSDESNDEFQLEWARIQEEDHTAQKALEEECEEARRMAEPDFEEDIEGQKVAEEYAWDDYKKLAAEYDEAVLNAEWLLNDRGINTYDEVDAKYGPQLDELWVRSGNLAERF